MYFQPSLLIAGLLLVSMSASCAEPVELDRLEAAAEPADDAQAEFELRDVAEAGPFTTAVLSNPARVVVSNASGQVATFTVGARTVTLAGPLRTFREHNAVGNTNYAVTHSTWVRAFPSSFVEFDSAAANWLTTALNANTVGTRDVLAAALEYIEAAPAQHAYVGGAGYIKVAGDAYYGYQGNEGSDYNDYLGISVTYSYPTGSVVDAPETKEFGSLDCSGFMRMIWGLRGANVPLTGDVEGGTGIPRRSFQIYSSAPGVLVIPMVEGSTVPPASLPKLSIGDLVFFDASTDDSTRIDHVGMFLGMDGTKYRFISSRKTVKGPTFGDTGGQSVLNCAGCLYSTSFRAARRL